MQGWDLSFRFFNVLRFYFVDFKGFLSRRAKKEIKGQMFLCQSKIHLARYNLRKCQSNLFEIVLTFLKNLSRFCYHFSRFLT